MIHNATTKSLEGMARARGLNFKIRAISDKIHTAQYYLLARDNIELHPPQLIGKTVRQAEIWIDRNKLHPSRFGKQPIVPGMMADRKHRTPAPKKPTKLL